MKVGWNSPDNLSYIESIEEYKEAIKEFINKNPNIKTVYGRGWSLGIFEGEELAKKILPMANNS